MTQIIIRAMPERSDEIAYLSAELPQAVWCIDKTCNAMDTFLDAMRLAGEQPAVHMEEDIVLTRNFQQKLDAAIAERPNDVIQFFSMRKADLTIGSRYDPGSRFMMNQCFYFPAGISKQVLEYAPLWERRREHPTGTDIMIADYLRNHKMQYWIHVPSLVQHKQLVSLIDSRRSKKRQSLTFVE
jgi:hypothetical protein